ncbi:hypothetical protein J4E89_010379 [Alternaria sp. Ai002NY15]|nr:hypothetical protein J4E89_010379 [Alternaria sp. Ai002NY15]
MSATGTEPPSLDTCPQGKQLVASAQQDNGSIKICLGHGDDSLGSIYVPYDLLESVYGESHIARYRQPKSGTALELLLYERNCPEVLGLFVQWLYTGKYTELNGPVKNLDRFTMTPLLDMCESHGKNTMEWTVKAAVLAWSLGQQLNVPAFQNYAMKRLFAAFSRPSERPLLTPTLYECVKRLDHRFPFMGLASFTDWNNKGPLARAIDVTIIRNWGDAAVVDQEELKSWDSLLKSNDTFREKFLEGSLLSLEQRREKVLVVEDYF